MSRTYKTRPYEVAYADPRNRHLRMIGNVPYPSQEGSPEWPWKPITSCKGSRGRCGCKWRTARERKKERITTKRDLWSLAAEDSYGY